jgi:nucleoside-diphosphate-sugar epimerase
VRTLARQGTPVRALVESEREAGDVALLSADIEPVVGDIRDPSTLVRLFAGPAEPTVFHTAGVIHPASGTREVFDVNVGGTDLVLDHARRVGAKRFVHVSSNSPFGYTRDPDDVFGEEAPYSPYMSYGLSKMEAEQLVMHRWELGDFETVIVRAPWFYGPDQPQRQTRFFSLVRRGVFPVCGDGTNRRSMVYVTNLVDGMLLAATTPAAAGRAYWIADARPYSMNEIVAAVRAALVAEGVAVARRQVRLPARVGDLAELADRFLQGRGRYSQQVHVLSEMNKTIACDIGRARRELGYEPAVELGEGMRRSVRWCLERGIDI